MRKLILITAIALMSTSSCYANLSLADASAQPAAVAPVEQPKLIEPVKIVEPLRTVEAPKSVEQPKTAEQPKEHGKKETVDASEDKPSHASKPHRHHVFAEARYFSQYQYGFSHHCW